MNGDWSQGRGLKGDKITYHQRQRVSVLKAGLGWGAPVFSTLFHYQLLHTFQQGALCSVGGRRWLPPHPGACNYVKSCCPSISLLMLVIIQKFPYRMRREYIYPSVYQKRMTFILFVSFIALINIRILHCNSTHLIK